MILVDYSCPECGGRSEHMVRNPAPSTVACPACRAPAQRRFSPVGLVGRAAAPAPPMPQARRRALCQDNPDVPGLCHMTEDAGRMWVARARKDNRALDREIERQERARAENPGVVPEPVTHDHGAGHSHGHGHGHGHADGAASSGPAAPGNGGERAATPATAAPTSSPSN